MWGEMTHMLQIRIFKKRTKHAFDVCFGTFHTANFKKKSKPELQEQIRVVCS